MSENDKIQTQGSRVEGASRVWTGSIEGAGLAGLFEDPPESADVHVRTEDREPPLPADVAALHVGMPYSAFNRLRTALAAAIGNARQWDTVDNGMVPFLHHSDCDGHLSPEECRAIAPALADAIERLPTQDVPPGYLTERQRALSMLEMIEACAKYERRFLFG